MAASTIRLQCTGCTGLRAPGRHLRCPKERGAGRGGSFQRLNSIRLQCTGCTFQRLLPRLPPDAGKAAMQEWAKGAGKGLRAPGRHLRGPKEKRCRPRWQLPEAQFYKAAVHRAARSRGSLPRLPPDVGKATMQEWAKGAGKGLRQARLRCRSRPKALGRV